MSTIATPPDVVASGAGRPTRAAGISLLAAGPACLACGVPFLWPALAAVGLGVPLGIAHTVSWLVVPLIVGLLAVNARRHGDLRPLSLAAAGAVVYGLHVVTHHVAAAGDVAFLLTDHVAVALLGGAALWDLAVTRRVRGQDPRVGHDDTTDDTPAGARVR